MTIFNASNATQLQAALATAVGGDKIILAAGNYGSVNVTGRTYAANVTIQSASMSNTAHFDGLFVTNSKNLTFLGLDLGRGLNAGEAATTQLNRVQGSSNIRLNGVTVHGSADGIATNDGTGLLITDSSSVKVDYSKFSDLYRGIAVQRSSGTTICVDSFDNMRCDGIVVAAATGIGISGNSFANFKPQLALSDHADAIQFWNTGQTSGSSNISIANNTIMPGYFSGVEGTGVQGIFISDPGVYGYKNVTIQNNMLYSNGAYHGIYVNGATGVNIIGNSALSQSTDNKNFWIMTDKSSNIVERDNVTDMLINRTATGLSASHNLDLAVTPSARTLFPNLLNPKSAADLTIADYGYHKPTTAVAALPASSEYSAASLGEDLVLADGGDTIDLSSIGDPNQPVLVAETGSAPMATPNFAADSLPLHIGFLEHFVAMA